VVDAVAHWLLRETPQSITVVTADRVTDQGALTVQESLRYCASPTSAMSPPASPAATASSASAAPCSAARRIVS